MASVAYNIGKKALNDGTINVGTDTFKAALLMTNTSAASEQDTDDIDSFTTLDEMDGSGYARGTLTLTSSVDDTDNAGEVTQSGNSLTFSSLGAGSRSVAGVLIYRHVTDDTDHIPIAWLEFASPVAANGQDFIVTFSSDGVWRLTD